jgi:hypothetical protein
MTALDYEDLLEHGWLRSGTHVYRPATDKCCCPNIPIRLDALDFTPTRPQLRVLRNLQDSIAGKRPIALPVEDRDLLAAMMEWSKRGPEERLAAAKAVVEHRAEGDTEALLATEDAARAHQLGLDEDDEDDEGEDGDENALASASSAAPAITQSSAEPAVESQARPLPASGTELRCAYASVVLRPIIGQTVRQRVASLPVAPAAVTSESLVNTALERVVFSAPKPMVAGSVHCDVVCNAAFIVSGALKAEQDRWKKLLGAMNSVDTSAAGRNAAAEPSVPSSAAVAAWPSASAWAADIVSAINAAGSGVGVKAEAAGHGYINLRLEPSLNEDAMRARVASNPSAAAAVLSAANLAATKPSQHVTAQPAAVPLSAVDPSEVSVLTAHTHAARRALKAKYRRIQVAREAEGRRIYFSDPDNIRLKHCDDDELWPSDDEADADEDDDDSGSESEDDDAADGGMNAFLRRLLKQAEAERLAAAIARGEAQPPQPKPKETREERAARRRAEKRAKREAARRKRIDDSVTKTTQALMAYETEGIGQQLLQLRKNAREWAATLHPEHQQQVSAVVSDAAAPVNANHMPHELVSPQHGVPNESGIHSRHVSSGGASAASEPAPASAAVQAAAAGSPAPSAPAPVFHVPRGKKVAVSRVPADGVAAGLLPFGPGPHVLTVTLTRTAYTRESHELYARFNIALHRGTPGDSSRVRCLLLQTST